MADDDLEGDGDGFDFGDLDPEDVDIEAMNAFHFSGETFFASFQLSDEDNEVSRSFLLKVEFGPQVRFEVLLQIDDFLLGHTSLEPDLHYVLEVGEIIHEVRGGSVRQTQIADGFFGGIWHLDASHMFVFGENGKSQIGSGMTWSPNPPAPSPFIRAMHGRDTKTIHAAGNAGSLARFLGTHWESVELPFSHQINAVHVGEDGTIYLACDGGNCFAVADETLVTIRTPDDGDFFSIAEFKGKRYWGDTTYGLYVQEGDRLVPFKPLEIVASMRVSDRYLVACGWKEVFIFDGQNWSGFEMGYDGDIFLRPVDMTQFS